MEKQVDFVRSKKDEEITKLSADKKALHNRLNDAESQLSMVKARNHEELKVRIIVALHNICLRYVYADQSEPFIFYCLIN
jgi:CRISPR/Cas system CMR-associated protein Cmr5 small subunit